MFCSEKKNIYVFLILDSTLVLAAKYLCPNIKWTSVLHGMLLRCQYMNTCGWGEYRVRSIKTETACEQPLQHTGPEPYICVPRAWVSWWYSRDYNARNVKCECIHLISHLGRTIVPIRFYCESRKLVQNGKQTNTQKQCLLIWNTLIFRWTSLVELLRCSLFVLHFFNGLNKKRLR